MYTWEQASGKLYDDDLKVIGIGYSGDPAHKNNPEAERLVAEGPIPRGVYTITGPPFDSTQHGHFCLRLVPDSGTAKQIEAYGRNPWSFLIHGDSVKTPGTASEGCIILDRGTRETLAADLAVNKDLIVVAVVSHPDIDGEISI